MASNNRLWGAERIRGELLKLDIHVCECTIQKYILHVCTSRSRGQCWATFLRNHAGQIWACDFLQVTDLFFRPFFAFINTLAEVVDGHPCDVIRSPTHGMRNELSLPNEMALDRLSW